MQLPGFYFGVSRLSCAFPVFFTRTQACKFDDMLCILLSEIGVFQSPCKARKYLCHFNDSS